MGTKKNRERKTKRRVTRRIPVVPQRSVPDWPLFIAACIGAVLTGFLLWNDLTSGVLPYCEFDSGCDVVQNSRWSNFLGIRLSAWGLAAYTAIGLCAVFPATASKRRRWSSFLVSVGLGVSVYLTVISIAILQTICIYCVLSLLIMASAFGLGFFPVEQRTKPSSRLAGLSLALVVVLVMQIDADGMFDGSDTSADPYLRELAEHLTQRGAKFYGASWCPHCQDQKELFGGAARYLPYVECSPHGPKAPRATTCEIEDIKNYPTWSIDGRRLESVLTIDSLARTSGFRERVESKDAEEKILE